MAKLSGPLMSLGARGSIAKTIVTSKWRGIAYARQHVIPANPKTTAQMFVRNMFAALREMWKVAPTVLQAPWDAFASGRQFLGMNKWVGENVRVLKGEADLNNLIMSPGARGGLAPDSFSAATGAASGEITFDFAVPASPPGWTLTAAVAVAIADQAPDAIFQGVIGFEEVTMAPWDGIISGLVPATDYQVGGWLVWTKPDGKLAYSVSIVDQATSDA